MHIEHIAIWTHDLERLRTFYETYFQASSGTKYTNPSKQFESYFLSFAGGARLELMRIPSLAAIQSQPEIPPVGLTHLAFSTGSKEAVDVLTRRLREDGYRVLDGPRTTGDGYYESAILDPDGNRIEVTL